MATPHPPPSRPLDEPPPDFLSYLEQRFGARAAALLDHWLSEYQPGPGAKKMPASTARRA
jgi:hypothetical protein